MISRKKTFVLITLMLVGLLATLFATSSIILMGSFSDLERQGVHQDVQRAMTALQDSVEKVDYITRDWAWWDETYEFIQNRNSDYRESNLNDTSLAGIKLNVLIYVDAAGRTVFATGFDMEKGRSTPLPKSLRSHLHQQSTLVRHTSPRSFMRGLLLLPEGPLMVASRPILTGNGEGPIRGTLIMGKYLDAEEIRRIGSLTHLSVVARPITGSPLPPDFRQALHQFNGGASHVIEPLDSDTIAGYALLKDVYRQPSLLLRTETSRDISAQGVSSVRYFLFWCLSLGLIVAGGFQLLIDRILVLNRGQKSAQARYRAVVEQASEGILLVDTESKRLLETNKALRRLLGYSQEEIQDLTLYDLSAHDAENVDRFVLKTVEWNQLYVGERQYRHKNGTLIDVELSGKMISYGTADNLCIVVRDIRERKRAEAELRESQERYELAANGANDGLWDWNLKKNEIYFSPRWKAMLGLCNDTVKDLPDEWMRRVHPEDVIGIKRGVPKRPPKGVAWVGGMDRLIELATEADHVVVTLPNTPATQYVINREVFTAMKPSAYLYNVGRGITIDQDALVRALEEGQIAGAGLDVTTPEPLPDDHPLWRLENVILTPHVSGLSPRTRDRQIAHFAENLRRYVAGEELLSLSDKEAGY